MPTYEDFVPTANVVVERMRVDAVAYSVLEHWIARTERARAALPRWQWRRRRRLAHGLQTMRLVQSAFTSGAQTSDACRREPVPFRAILPTCLN